MKVQINTEVLPESFRWDPRNPVTGTTKFYVRVAEELTKKGAGVAVVYDGPRMAHQGVEYLPRDFVAPGPWVPDLQIDCNIDTATSTARRVQWTSFFGRPDVCVGDGYERLFLVSDYIHSTLQHAVKCPVTVLELGCDMPTVAEPHLAARPRQCCYTSSPDRGGTFLQQIWPEVERQTHYRLVCSPYNGNFSSAEMRTLLLTSRFWLYPAIGLDSIISTLEAQASGCIPVYVPHMALPETCRYGVQSPDIWKFADTVVETLNKADAAYLREMESVRKTALEAKPIPTWSDVVDRILESLT